MCLTVKSGCKIEIAKNPIAVYRMYNKHGFIFNRRWGPSIWETSKRWKYNKLIKSCEHLTIQGNNMVGQFIGPGFHSHLVKNDSNINAIIPIGSEYCLGEFNEIVSNQIIVFSSKRHLKKYLSRS